MGSGQEKLGAVGIHWHMAPSIRVTYITTDDKRQTIPYVEVDDGSGKIRKYRAEGVTDEELARGERRTMDCMDCHNRPSHRFDTSPERAVNEAMAHGEIPRDLPFIRREAVAALKVTYPSQADAAKAIADRLQTFYRTQFPETPADRQAAIKRAVTTVQGLYVRNVFPDMKVTWGTYPNNIGHQDFPGCFRCHDDAHKASDGSAISQDCSTCHTIEG